MCRFMRCWFGSCFTGLSSSLASISHGPYCERSHIYAHLMKPVSDRNSGHHKLHSQSSPSMGGIRQRATATGYRHIVIRLPVRPGRPESRGSPMFHRQIFKLRSAPLLTGPERLITPPKFAVFRRLGLEAAIALPKIMKIM